jgi:ATP-binding cassette subfamily B protein
MSDGAQSSPESFDPDALFFPNVERRLRHLPRLVGLSVRLVWRSSRRLLIAIVLLQIAVSVAVAGQVIVIRSLLARLIKTQTNGSFTSVTPMVIGLAVILAFVSVAGLAKTELQRVLSEVVGRHCLRRVIARASSVDLVAFDDPGFHDRLQRASVNATIRPLQMTSGLLGLGGSLLGVLGVGTVLLFVEPLFFVLILAAAVPVALTSVRIGRSLYEFEVQQTPASRQRQYLETLLLSKDPAKEVRAYQLAPYLTQWFDRLYDDRIARLRVLMRSRLRAGIGAALLTAAVTGSALGLLIWSVADGRASLASAGTAAVALLVVGTQLQSMAAGIGQLYESSLFVQDFTSFVDSETNALQTTEVSSSNQAFGEVKADDIWFTYPSRSEPTLRGVSLEIAPGEVIALVGENGSGKTTLAKLLAGLYRPQSGHLTWGGVELAALKPGDIHDRVAVLFQDFLRYYLTARENITMGRSEFAHDVERMRAAAEKAGADQFLRDLPNGYETSLSPQFFGGSDLSGGQWQRLALARAFFRDADFVILDEPTASLDPRSEADLFAAVRELFAGRSVVLISHRYSSVRLADRIYVLDAGEVVEAGTHDALMVERGRYCELFTLQASAFHLGSMSDSQWPVDTND